LGCISQPETVLQFYLKEIRRKARVPTGGQQTRHLPPSISVKTEEKTETILNINNNNYVGFKKYPSILNNIEQWFSYYFGLGHTVKHKHFLAHFVYKIKNILTYFKL
jgi:hypothetical protein